MPLTVTAAKNRSVFSGVSQKFGKVLPAFTALTSLETINQKINTSCTDAVVASVLPADKSRTSKVFLPYAISAYLLTCAFPVTLRPFAV